MVIQHLLLDKVSREEGRKQSRVGLTYIVAGRGEFGGSAHVVVMLPERRKRRREGEDSVREKRREGEKGNIKSSKALYQKKTSTDALFTCTADPSSDRRDSEYLPEEFCPGPRAYG